MESVRIEPATVADLDRDLERITELIRELYAAMTEPPSGDAEDIHANCRVLLDDPAYRLLIARTGERLIGLVNFTTRRTLSHTRPSALIDELIVTAEYRGRGVGEQLIAAVASLCRELGCEELEVSTELSNHAAREFYRKCGFDEEAVLLELQLDN